MNLIGQCVSVNLGVYDRVYHCQVSGKLPHFLSLTRRLDEPRDKLCIFCIMSSTKKNVLLVGGGSVGAIAALNLESGGQATVTAVLRSNFDTVEASGYRIESCDHGSVRGWRPSRIINNVPEAGEPPFDYVVCTTKNIADVTPTTAELISSAVTPGHTVIVLIQNGLNIEKPFLTLFRNNVVLSGVSLIGANEPQPGVIHQDFPDTLFVGPFENLNMSPDKGTQAAQNFVKIYAAAGKTKCVYSSEVGWTRWRKLVYNACLNPVCAITGLDTGRIRLADGAIDGLVRPAMEEIRAAAAASGHSLPDDVADSMIEMDPLDMYLPPSMLSDVRKGNFIEYENILGEPLREGKALGVPMPTLQVLYHLCQAIQWKSKELKGLVEIPVKGKFVG